MAWNHMISADSSCRFFSPSTARALKSRGGTKLYFPLGIIKQFLRSPLKLLNV